MSAKYNTQRYNIVCTGNLYTPVMYFSLNGWLCSDKKYAKVFPNREAAYEALNDIDATLKPSDVLESLDLTATTVFP